MTISYPRSLPSEMVIQRAVLRPRNIAAEAASRFTSQRQIHAHQGQFWEIEVDLAPHSPADAAAVTAWLSSLEGIVRTFYMGDPMRPTPLGTAASSPGTPLIAGGSQTGQEIDGDSGPTSETGWLVAGDYVQIGTGTSSRLYKMLEDVSTDGSGDFTMSVWPQVRTAFSDNETIAVSGAVGLFRLIEDPEWDEETVITGASFRARSVP